MEGFIDSVIRVLEDADVEAALGRIEAGESSSGDAQLLREYVTGLKAALGQLVKQVAVYQAGDDDLVG